jgi:hypothetical protein
MPETYTIKVDKDRIIGKIDPRIYGYLVEHQGRCIYGGYAARIAAAARWFSRANMARPKRPRMKEGLRRESA